MIGWITAAQARAASAMVAGMLGAAALAQAAQPALPHVAHPGAVPYPDYYTLARSHTTLEDDPALRPLRLRTASRQAEPAFIVLPVQTQAYAFMPTFRALVGARLDQELARRHVDASAQTDIVDWRGPFTRRADDATVAALASEHPRATLLVPYLGHDGAGHAFLDLSRRLGGQVRSAHREIAIAMNPTDTLTAVGAALPGLLAELGLGDARPADALAPARTDGCVPAHWNLADLPPSAAPDDVACHAVLMGTLMPDYFARMGFVADPPAPDRLAWLARAWVEATPLAARSPAMRSIATLAVVQLQFEGRAGDASGEVDSHDAVVRPLARMLWAHQRAAMLPRNSTDRAADDYLQPELAGLPPFAAAVLETRSAFVEAFHRTDLCPLQLALPHFRIPPGCDDDDPGAKPAARAAASLSETKLLETWRLAAAWGDLHVEGVQRGSPSDVAALTNGMPASIAAHPFIRQMQFAARRASGAPRDAAGHRAWAEAAIRNYALAVVTLQRNDPLIATNEAADAAVPAERTTPTISVLLDDLDRLASVVRMDSPGSSAWPSPGVAAGVEAFLADGPFLLAKSMVVWQEGSGPVAVKANPAAVLPERQALVHPGLVPAPALVPTTFTGTAQGAALPSREALEARLASTPSEMTARMALALVALEHGQGTDKARQILDARPRSMRSEDAVGETADLFSAASVFYFSGELAIAREYCVRAAALDTGSNADMAARARIAAIDGDLATARREVHRRVLRYDDDVAVAQEAGYLFMAGRAAQAWPMIDGRAPTSRRPDLWRAALSGHRIQGDALATLPGWLQQTGLDRVNDIESGLGGYSWIHVYATLDRLPTLPDAETLKAVARSDPGQGWTQGILTRRSAIDGTRVADAKALEADAVQRWFGNQNMLPFYSWALWNTTGGKAAPLDFVREASVDSGFAGALSKAMVLAADGRRDDALRLLTAARYELGRTGLYGTPYALRDPMRTAAHDFVLATWLMSRKTGERAYAAQGLAIARAYQRIDAWMAWPYAAEALLGKDRQAREIAACRALKLDADSMFLHESGLHPDPNSATCRKATAW